MQPNNYSFLTITVLHNNKNAAGWGIDKITLMFRPFTERVALKMSQKLLMMKHCLGILESNENYYQGQRSNINSF